MPGLPLQAAQLTLGFTEGHAPTFDLYVPGPNGEAYEHLRALAHGHGHRSTYLYGALASGKTHLLRACREAYAQTGRSAAYLVLTEQVASTPQYFDTLIEHDLVCLDDIQALAGNPQAERGLLRLYEGLCDLGHLLLCAGNRPPGALGLGLPDLESRLGWGLVLHLQALRDRDKMAVLQRRSEARGFELPLEAAHYVLARCPRDLTTLCGMLDRLDDLTLKTHRRLTIPLIRTLLDQDPEEGGL